MDWRYHPQEIAWRSLPDSDHALPQRLVLALQEHRPTGWVRHGGDFDAMPSGIPGAARDAGLHAVLVASGLRTLLSLEGHPDLALQRSLLRSCDLVVAQGMVDGSCPLVVELDADGKGLETLAPRDLGRVAALVGTRGPRMALPPGGIPRFPLDAMDELAEHLLDLLETRGRERPLVGILLAAPDEAAEAQAAAARALEERCGRVVRISTNAQGPTGIETIAPSHPSWGDGGRILTAFEAFPDASLLVVSPAPEHVARLDRLLAERDVLAVATAYRARDTHMPDTGAIVWEPRARAALAATLATGSGCERRALVQSGTTLLDR